MQNPGVRIHGCCWIAFALFASVLSGIAQEKAKTTKPGSGKSIFDTERACKATTGSLRAQDLTVLDFRIGVSTIGDVRKRFTGTNPVKLTRGEEAETGICVKNAEGETVVFATGVMGSPKGTLTAIYLTPVQLTESSGLMCQSAGVPSKEFSSTSGIRVGISSAQLSKIVHAKIPAKGMFCADYEIPANEGLLVQDKTNGEQLNEFTDSTGVVGSIKKGKLVWVALYGIPSN